MSKTILVVDDSTTVTLSLSANLRMHGFTVETAGDGAAALKRLQGGLKPDLIISDVHMPNMNGIEMVRAIKAMPALKFKPILMLTTESDPKKRDETKKLGVTGWLVKPVSGADLLKVVQQVLPVHA
ncbi:MAG: response regulator [Betaproteobacteria bacterium]|nr:response regulator [Betaproteobacteria bacterium]MCC6250157.1 response regulator [Rubrivivax sp.]